MRGVVGLLGLLAACASSLEHRAAPQPQPAPAATWLTVQLDSAGALEVPPGSHHETSRSGETTLHRFVIGQAELCRVFDQATGVARTDLEAARQALREVVTSGNRAIILTDHAVQQNGRQGSEWLVQRHSGQQERVRIFVSPGHLFLVTAAVAGNGSLSADAQRCLDSFR